MALSNCLVNHRDIDSQPGRKVCPVLAPFLSRPEGEERDREMPSVDELASVAEVSPVCPGLSLGVTRPSLS